MHIHSFTIIPLFCCNSAPNYIGLSQVLVSWIQFEFYMYTFIYFVYTFILTGSSSSTLNSNFYQSWEGRLCPKISKIDFLNTWEKKSFPFRLQTVSVMLTTYSISWQNSTVLLAASDCSVALRDYLIQQISELHS